MADEVSVDSSIVVDDSHFQYLKLQKGKLDDIAGDRDAWHAAYERDLLSTYLEIRPHLPESCWGILDVGSGLGGIDVLLSRHYRHHAYIHLLDGQDDPPKMVKHRQTFNNMNVARDFLVRNGVQANRFAYYTPNSDQLPKPYDLVVSFGSWCFHYEPDVYLPLLLRGGGLHRESIIIVDVRNDIIEYDRQLGHSLECIAVIRRSRKFTRAVFRRWQ